MMDAETCPCPGWRRILCRVEATLNATPTHLAWLYRWHMRYVVARFDKAFANGEPTRGPLVPTWYTASPATLTWTSSTTSTFTGPTP